MRHVEPLKILGCPQSTGEQLPCPSGHCQSQCDVNEDGSVLCPEHGFYEPEATLPADSALMQKRCTFDQQNGITVSDRVLGPGATSLVNRL